MYRLFHQISSPFILGLDLSGNGCCKYTFKDDFYWSAENSRGEIDFLVQDEERIIPIEVKAEENLQAKSLRVFVERNQGLKGMRLSMSPYREQDRLANYPLYSVSAIFD